MYRNPRAVLTAILLMVLPALMIGQKTSVPSTASDVDIPYKKFVLDNGLTLLVHEDHKAPIVAVNVWYHVGSKNEKAGRTGFAHLFEHLMFNGSENFNDDYFQALERVGATNLNGTTSEDRTNYFQNVPTSAVDVALWMESDRMGHLLGAVDQKKLDEQRGVVQNEKRQGDNQPYAVAYDLITKATWPAGHPYSWTVIGSMEDLNAASLPDVHEWFKSYYGAANAVLTVAGDITPEVALEKVKKYFGDIPAGPPVARFNAWIAKRTGTQHASAQDRVPQARIYKVWNAPGYGTADAAYLDLLGNILSSGKTSRLYKRLVYDEQTCTSVSARMEESEIAGQFTIEATAKPGGDLTKIEQAIDEELAKLLKSGPTDKELQRVKAQYRARFIRGLERIGGFGGKSDILAQNLVYAGDTEHYKVTFGRMTNATAKDIQRAGQEWLSDGVYVLEVVPFGQFKTVPTDTTLRKHLPAPSEPPVATFPALQRTTLANGLKVILAERHSVPVVNFNLLIDAGYASDQYAVPGTANLAMSMLDEGTTTKNVLQLSDELALLGANLMTGSSLDVSTVTLSALKSNLDASLALFADVLLNPSFPADEFTRQQKQTLSGIQRELSQPNAVGMRVMPKLLFGAGHAYANPLSGTGTMESVGKLKRDDMVTFYQTWIKSNNATLVIVGDVTMEDIRPKLEKLLAAWKPGDVPKKNIGAVQGSEKSAVFIVDRPGAQQSVVLAGQLAPPKNTPQDIAIVAMNTILGGSFTSRINMNIREDKHWSYGARTMIVGARGQRPYFASAPVQSDKTKETMIEVKKEIADIMAKRPATPDELQKVQSNLTLALPGSWETMGAIASSIENIVNYGLPDNYYETYPQQIRALSTANVTEAAKSSLRPENLVWVIVGDRAKIEAGIRELGFGEVRVIDANGDPVK
jgi:zinc protease